MRKTVEHTDCSGLPAGLAPSVSIGLAQHSSGESPDAVLQHAGAALYAAKQAGRNRVVPAA